MIRTRVFDLCVFFLSSFLSVYVRSLVLPQDFLLPLLPPSSPSSPYSFDVSANACPSKLNLLALNVVTAPLVPLTPQGHITTFHTPTLTTFHTHITQTPGSSTRRAASGSRSMKTLRPGIASASVLRRSQTAQPKSSSLGADSTTLLW